MPAPGFNHVQVYTISTNTWTWSGAAGSPLQPLPTARGGMGTGVYLNGSIYVIGGETSARPPTNGVFTNVEIYNIASNTWSTGTPLPQGRHGSYPVTDGASIFMAGGGTQSGYSASNNMMRLFVRLISEGVSSQCL